MTPHELAKLHPRLFHLTTGGAGARILKNGLFRAKDIVSLWDIPESEHQSLLTRRRPDKVVAQHPVYGSVTINDNAPLDEVVLKSVLDDGLDTSDWLQILNGRTFFFTSEMEMAKLRNARLNRGYAKDILTIDTLRFAQAYGELIDLVPINSGSTLFNTPRRGLSTFSPLLQTYYPQWASQRGNRSPDTIKEVAVRSSIIDIAQYIVELKEGVLHD